jgi:hypothetical protein
MTVDFKCGCFFLLYYDDKKGEHGGLSCCPKHEQPEQTLEGLGPVEFEKVRLDRK